MGIKDMEACNTGLLVGRGTVPGAPALPAAAPSALQAPRQR
jgi:hypothetical protein